MLCVDHILGAGSDEVFYEPYMASFSRLKTLFRIFASLYLTTRRAINGKNGLLQILIKPLWNRSRRTVMNSIQGILRNGKPMVLRQVLRSGGFDILREASLDLVLHYSLDDTRSNLFCLIGTRLCHVLQRLFGLCH